MVTRSTTVDRGDFLHFLYLCIGNVVKAKNWEVLATKKSSVTTLNQKTSDPASYPYVSFSIKFWAQRKAGSRNRASRFSPSHSPLRFTTHGHPRVTRVSRSPLCQKRNAWEEGSPRTAGPKIKFTIRFFHIHINAPSLPSKSLHNCCFQFLLGITVVPREIKDNRYATFERGGGKQGCIVVYVKMVNSLGHVRESNPGPLAC